MRTECGFAIITIYIKTVEAISTTTTSTTFDDDDDDEKKKKAHSSWLFLTHIYQWVEIILKLCASNYRYNLLWYVYFWWQESHYGKILFSLHKIQVLVKSSLGEKGLRHAIKAFRCSKLNINNNHIFCKLLVWHNFATRFAQCSHSSLTWLWTPSTGQTDERTSL